MKFLVDAQLPPALARWITGQGHQAAHLFDLGFHSAEDLVVWQRAQDEHAILITKDEDSVDRWLLNDKPVPLLWIRKGNCSNRALLAWLQPLWPDAVQRFEQGERLVELRA